VEGDACGGCPGTGYHRRCTPDREKYDHWAETVPKTLRNPLYHWTHMELKRPFGISDRLLDPHAADSIWSECSEKLAQPEFTCRSLIQQFDVRVVCTTDALVDKLEHHKTLAADKSFPVRVLPAWRPDKVMALDDLEAWNRYIDELAGVSGVEIHDIGSLLEALKSRQDFF
jgi:glucuronate isomerase